MGRRTLCAHCVMKVRRPRPTFSLTVHSAPTVSSAVIPKYEDIHDAIKVESIGWILMERYEAWKNLNQIPDARSIVSYIINYIVGAASGSTRGIGS